MRPPAKGFSFVAPVASAFLATAAPRPARRPLEASARAADATAVAATAWLRALVFSATSVAPLSWGAAGAAEGATKAWTAGAIKEAAPIAPIAIPIVAVDLGAMAMDPL
mmetsp:Transcript_44164/g.105160  ORF Transcript_44164/g.105160 Transcript_44164/m.105160 type:complete len:109 (-) Transcript_44164:37-363(-)